MSKIEKQPNSDDESRSPNAYETSLPTQLKCPLCNDLLRDAVLAICCGDSFCDECIRSRLIGSLLSFSYLLVFLESDAKQCPGVRCQQTGISPDSLVPNLKVRQAVDKFRNESGYVQRPTDFHQQTRPQPPQSNQFNQSSSTQPQVISRVRIGLANTSSTSSALPSVLSHLMSKTVGQFQGDNNSTSFNRQQQTLSAIESEAPQPTPAQQQSSSTSESYNDRPFNVVNLMPSESVDVWYVCASKTSMNYVLTLVVSKNCRQQTTIDFHINHLQFYQP